MDWTKQNEEMFNTWKQAQTKMWEAYTESVSNFGKSPSEKAWDQAIAAGNELIKNSLISQADWLKAWVDNIKKLDGLPDQATVALDQFQEMNASWVATQEKLWGAWFEMLKKIDPGQFSGTWSNLPKDPFQSWQESTKVVMDTQMEWMQSWINQFKPEKDE
jgi:hypothetical protein